MDGVLFATTGSALPYLITRPTTIDTWYIYSENRGMPSGTIIADVNLYRGGVSTTIFTNQANRPMLAFEDSDGWASTTPGLVNFLEGDILVPDIDQISTGSSGLVLVGKISGIGGGSSLTVEEVDGSPFVPNVNTIIFPNGSVTNNGGGVVSIANIIQAVQHTSYTTTSTHTTIFPVDDTIPQNTEGSEIMTCAITPKSATNLLRIDVLVNGTIDTVANLVTAVFQDTTANALVADMQVVSSGSFVNKNTIIYWMTAGTTSTTTFKVRVGPDRAATVTVNGSGGVRFLGGTLTSSITITEVIP
jgi:hypothetical protein